MVKGALRLLVVGAVVAAGLGLAAAPAAAAPTLTVTPATGLLDQQIVTVTGSGFDPDDQLVVAQCPGTTLDGCNLNPPFNTTGALVAVDTAGTLSATLRLSRVLGSVSCAEVACAIVAAHPFHGPARAHTPLGFAPTGTAITPDATFALDAPDVRANGVTATWRGTGYRPGFEVMVVGGLAPVRIFDGYHVAAGPGAYVAICTSPPDGWAGCERYVGPLFPWSFPNALVGDHEYVGVHPDGTVSQLRRLRRLWVTRSGRVDCAVEDCSFALEQDGAPHSNVVDVTWAPEWAPWPSARAFVVEAYVALVGRVPTATERSAAITGLTDRSLTGFTFVRQLAGRPDARRLAELTRLYQAALGRRPDATGLLYWESELRRTGSMAAIAGAFSRSREFRQVFGSVSDADAVLLAYQRTLGREPSATELDYWERRLQVGMSRTHLVHLFSRTPEYLAREAGRSEVAAAVVALLGRDPSTTEWFLSGPTRIEGTTPSERADDVILDVLSDDGLIAEVG